MRPRQARVPNYSRDSSRLPKRMIISHQIQIANVEQPILMSSTKPPFAPRRSSSGTLCGLSTFALCLRGGLVNDGC
ncbi:hypothetical protein M433DRAFT_157106 [Acidomyces richmondensis BFW]|nr:MAG: hypothetical protein FE78DRAFT_94198 [Acidomyces sp. 'richmondensis']KYG43123.1 hypothetical protein M433DRAFT_157106 [Acidomyces richmondensis BFW]